MVSRQQTCKPVGLLSLPGDRIRTVELRNITCILPQTKYSKIIESKGVVAHRGDSFCLGRYKAGPRLGPFSPVAIFIKIHYYLIQYSWTFFTVKLRERLLN